MADFDTAIGLVLRHEGGYVNNPADQGGETNFGICKRSYPNIDIKNLTIKQAKGIYRKDFWNPIQGDSIAAQNVANNLLDFAVNAGVTSAVKMVQRAVAAGVDGIMGSQTIGLLNSRGSSNTTFIKGRISYYASIVSNKPSQAVFLPGWVNRTLDYL